VHSGHPPPAQEFEDGYTEIGIVVYFRWWFTFLWKIL
jgi:hypothetical protein